MVSHKELKYKKSLTRKIILNQKKLSYFSLAYNMACKSQSRFRLGAVVVHKRRVVSTGFNCMGKTHPIMRKFSKHNWLGGIHAEIHACLGIPLRDLSHSSIYICRILKNGNKALSNPCNTCQRFMISIGIKNVYYTINENDIGLITYNI